MINSSDNYLNMINLIVTKGAMYGANLVRPLIGKIDSDNYLLRICHIVLKVLSMMLL